uniref:Uncharacterized protein n=1 Tax=Avena sativa TaxID=4498 RepID=A0ACD5YVP9_AVESA
MDKQSSQECSFGNESDASNQAVKPNLVAMQLQLLPPDVMRDILSRLSLKEVVRMSMLSREWKLLRICHPDMVFTKETFGIDTTNTYQGSMTVGDLLKVRAKKMELLTRKFIDHVDSVLRPLWSTSSTTTTTLDKFVVKFVLHRKHKYYIDRWVTFSTASRSKHIALDFTSDDESCFGSAFDKYRYALPLTNFSGPNGSCIRSLYLGNVYLELPPSLCGITNLKKLTLNKVSINDGDLQLLLLSCALLKSLNIEKCSSLSSLRIQQELSRLQYLRVRYCDLEILELDPPNLTAFEFDDYLMQTVLTESSKLSDVIFVSNLRVLDGYDDVLDHIFTDLPAALPHLQTLLLLLTACQVRRFSNTRDSFMCLRHLNMNLDSPLYHDDSWVMGFVNLLELAPLLKELEVHVSGSVLIRVFFCLFSAHKQILH